MKSKAQASVEYLMVVGLAFVIITPMIYMFYQYTSSTQEDVSMAKIYKIGNDIVSASEQVYYLGEPSRSSVTVHFPDMIYNVTSFISADPSCLRCSLLVFYYGDEGFQEAIVIPAKVPINVTLNSTDFSAGKHQIVAQARSTEVIIRGPSS